MCIPLVPPPLSHKFSNEEKKKLTSMQYQHTIQLTCISNQSILLETHCSQLTQPDY